MGLGAWGFGFSTMLRDGHRRQSCKDEGGFPQESLPTASISKANHRDILGTQVQDGSSARRSRAIQGSGGQEWHEHDGAERQVGQHDAIPALEHHTP